MKNFKQKWENYWYYYKVPTILVIIFVLAAVLFFTSNEDMSARDGKIRIVTSGVLSTKEINFDEYVQGKIEDLDKDGIVSLNITEHWVTGDGSNNSDAATFQQVLSSFSTGDTGLYIFDKANLERFMIYDAFEPLQNVLDETVLNEHETFMRDEKIYAISLKGLGLAEKYEFNTDELYAAVIFDRPIEDTEEDAKKYAENAKVLLGELLK